MAVSMVITPGELERQASLCYENKMLRVMCLSDPGRQIEVTDSMSTCLGYQVPEGMGGYEIFEQAVPTGWYDPQNTRYQLPPIYASFNGVEQGFTYDTLVVEINRSNYPHSIIRVSDPLTLSHGQIKTYRITLIHDD